MTSLEARWVGVMLKFAMLVMPLVAGIVAIAFLADMRDQPRPMPSKIALTGPLAAR